MCGFAGIYQSTPKPGALPRARHMAAAIAHRGPDGAGAYEAERIAMAHHRLAIIDLDDGAQPMAALDERYHIVFNGAIYNYRTLRAELASLGYVFKTASDTEVIPIALHHWGVGEGLQRLRGMFAFALYDKKHRTLVLARDRVGIKPLYYYAGPSEFTFASEIKALLADEGTPRRACAPAINDFLEVGVTLPARTAFVGIEEVQPGSWLEVEDNQISVHRYWQWQSQPQRQDAAALERCGELLEDSVRYHLEADVGVSSLLSGGIDSSLVSYYAAKHAPVLPTYTVGFAEAAYDESLHAQHVASIIQSDHHSTHLAEASASPELFERIVTHYDQPFGDSSAIPTWLVMQEVAKHTKVVLSGDGGDELFGGYPRYLTADALARAHRAPFVMSLISPLLSRAAGLVSVARRAYKFAEFSRRDPPHQALALHTYFDANARSTLLHRDFCQWLEAGRQESPLVLHYPGGCAPPQAMMDMELATVFVGDSLRKIDMASAVFGLEVRLPFVDAEVMDFASKLPLACKVTHTQTKVLLRRMVKNLLGAPIAKRPKQGFGIPLDRWCTGKTNDYLNELLMGSRSPIGDMVQPKAVEQLLKAFRQRKAQGPQLSRYQVYQRVFMLASLALWRSRFSPEF